MKKVIGLFLVVSSVASASFASQVCGVVGSVDGTRQMIENDGREIVLLIPEANAEIGEQIDQLNGDLVCAEGRSGEQGFTVESIRLVRRGIGS